MVVAKLFNAGDQTPVIPFIEVVGKAVSVDPEHTGVIGLNVGVIDVLTSMVIFVFVAHCPIFGVNVYSVVAVLFMAGDQVPVIPLFDVVGKAGIELPVQYELTEVKVGVVD